MRPTVLPGQFSSAWPTRNTAVLRVFKLSDEGTRVQIEAGIVSCMKTRPAEGVASMRRSGVVHRKNRSRMLQHVRRLDESTTTVTTQANG